MSTQDYDVLIVGGGPAGAAAGIAAGRHDLRVTIVESAETPPAGNCPAWLGPAAIECCTELGVAATEAGVATSGVVLRSWDLAEHVNVTEPGLTGLVVDPASLTAQLLTSAESGGASIQRPTTVAALELGAEHAVATLDSGQALRARVVILADGVHSPTARLAGTPAVRSLNPATCALAVSDTRADPGAIELILGGGNPLKQVVIARGSAQTRVALYAADSGAEAQLAAMIANLQQAEILPATARFKISAVAGLAGAALEMESHVGKYTLTVGAAGGFIASFSHEALYPALRSGILAADVAAEALGSAVLQDALSSYSTVWRSALADYLRMPSTDLGLLLPMVFNNPQMSARVARAFLLGQAF